MAIPIIGVTESEEEPGLAYFEAVEAAGGKAFPINVNSPLDIKATMAKINGLLLSGGADIHPSHYGEAVDPAAGVRSHPNRDANELPLVRAAIDRDLPVFGICRGMQAINVLMGGKLVQDLPGHRVPRGQPPLKHDVFIPPGARLTAILGMGGFMKVNSQHHQGVRWAQKAPHLLVSAYSLLKDGIIEGIESTQHFWLLGVQWHPERTGEVSRPFQNLFASFVRAADQRRSGSDPSPSPSPARGKELERPDQAS